MKEENTLAKNIETADGYKTSLDTVCKKLLAHKIILAWIMKSCVEEYKDCSIREIEEKYIEDIPEISKTAVHRDETAHNNGTDNSAGGRGTNNSTGTNSRGNPETIGGARNEDSSMTEGTVTYDIKFNAIRPQRGDEALLNMILNIEGQTQFYPGYPLIKRGIYYGGRMISSQYGTVFTESQYENIRKVYSIWVCLNPPKYRSNSINVYSFKEKNLLGKVKEKTENYDLITAIMICLGDEDNDGHNDEYNEKNEKHRINENNEINERDKNCNDLIRLLTVLLSTKKSPDEKKTILETEFDISMTREMREEASDMCDFSNYIEERGRAEGHIESKIEDILDLLEDLGKIPERVLECIQKETDLDVLRKWLKHAAKAASIAEFEANM